MSRSAAWKISMDGTVNIAHHMKINSLESSYPERKTKMEITLQNSCRAVGTLAGGLPTNFFFVLNN